MRRIVLLVLCGLAALSLFGAVAQAAPSAAGTSDRVTAFNKTSDVRVTMPDGVSLDTDEYVPTTGCPCPVIMVQTPYRKSGTAVGEYNPYFPSHGYAEIVVDVRGTGSSEGYWDSFGQDEQRDGAAMVRWAAKRPFSNGKIGLAGVSYSAINQFLTIEQPGTEAVKAIFPIVPMSDPYRDVTFAGGNTDTGFIPLWLGLVNGLNSVPADDAQQQPGIALNVQSQHLLDVAKFASQAVGDATLGGYESLLPAQAQTFPNQAYDGPFYRDVAPLNRIENVHVPTFIVGGEYDLFQRGEPLLYRGLNLPVSQKKLLFGPWYHGSPTANLTADDGSNPVRDQAATLVPSTNNLSLAWFDHWLKGANNGIDAFPTVETYQIGRSAWAPDSSFPATGTRYQPAYLDGTSSGSGAKALFDGSLTSKVGAAGSAQIPWQSITGECSRSAAQWTAGIVNISQCSADNSSAEIAGASFTGQPFKKDYTLSGPMMADIWVSSTRPDTTLVTTLTDVHPDGTSDRLTAGSQVASLGAVINRPCGAKVEDCSIYSGGQMTEPWDPYTKASQVMLTPGKPTELRIEIFPTSVVLQPGHRLRLNISTGDLPHQGPNSSTLANSAGGVDTIYYGGATPSAVYLGVVGGVRAAGSGLPRAAVAGAAQPPSAAGLATAGGQGVERAGTGNVAISRTAPVSTRLPLLQQAALAGATILLVGAFAATILRRRKAAG
ncbi:MAG: CocE/NonD family hydrolase [Candidatus Dormibacteria bacterium]